MATYIIVTILSYLIGSVSFAILFGKKISNWRKF